MDEGTATGPDDVHSTLEEINTKLDDILEAVKDNGSDWGGWIVVILAIGFFSGWSGSKLDRWTDRVWYSWRYDANWANVNVTKRPSTCDFFHSPVGSKGCEYKKRTDVFGPEQRDALVAQAQTEGGDSATGASPML